ncbi:MAG: 1-acyl-sn-glycerol-3-phosphate acyltransferase [Candidatus Marinimicrobia bacterium]|nr:1-acyl-sn-glycerol-3-phosphate acyltransferase [Candidatus Neomarinimicrobiota bacterium]MCF7840673.1 1-acyl-sn-glycerol-3-phosphate acyltransferase [Candidatus Neomarinimicrobiota bacterium]MCF7903342.1 1-acyl-sn-glycerol-3-phosphate acyltransferase [Candidatus Neomarinimicrobiota bacterium]
MLRYAYLMIVVVIVTIVCAILAMAAGLFDRTGNVGGWIARFWSMVILKTAGVRANVHGLEHLDLQEQYIFVGNHTSAFDIPLMFFYIPSQLRMIAKRELMYIPLFGWAMWMVKHYFIDRKNHRKALDAMAQVAEQFKRQRSSVCIFPEGTRSLDGNLKTFKKGGFILAIQTGKPIVPVVLSGAFELKPKYRHSIKPGVVEMTILPPIATRELTYAERDVLLNRVHDQFQEQLESGQERAGK